MAGSAGSIYVDLLLKDAKFVDGTKRASKALKDFGDAASKAAGITAKALGAAAVALGALSVRQALVIDSTVKLSRSLGIANEDFQALALLADEAGVEQEALGNLITKGQRAVVEASQGLETYAKAFRTLGLDTKKLLQLSPDKQFEATVEALSKIENPTLRNATAMQVFGRSGRQVINMLEDFAPKLEEARAFNDKFNISVSSIDGRKVEEANDTFARLGKVIGGLGNTIAIEVAPLITAMSNAFIQSGIDGDNMGKAVKSSLEGAASVIDTVREASLGLKAIFLSVAQAVLDLAVKFNEVRVAFSEFAVKVIESDITLQNLKAAQAVLENSRNFAGAAADEYAALEREAAKFETTSEKIARIQAEAQKRAEEAERKGLKPGAGGGVADGIDEKRAKTLASISSELEKQTEAVRIQNDNFGESEALIDRQLEQQKIMQKLREEGVNLSDAELSSLQEKLNLLQTEKQLNIELQEAEKARQKAADELIKKQEEQQRLLDESVQKVREQLVDGLIDAATGAGNFADKMKEVAKNIALAIVKAELLKAVTDATGGGGGGGFLGSLLSFLPSFDVGTDYVPYDMVAKIHKGERILTADENMAYQKGSGLTMNVYTPDADSFRASERQITRKIKSRMATA